MSDVGEARPNPSVNAACMSSTAVVNVEGVGDVKSAASNWPTTCAEVAKVPADAFVSENPVRAVAAIGLTPTFPAAAYVRDRIRIKYRGFDLLMSEDGTVDTPAFARMVKLPAVARLIAAGPAA